MFANSQPNKGCLSAHDMQHTMKYVFLNGVKFTGVTMNHFKDTRRIKVFGLLYVILAYIHK